MNDKKYIIAIDDNDSVRCVLESIIELFEFEPLICEKSDEFLEILNKYKDKVAVCIIDMILEDDPLNGEDCIKHIKDNTDIPCICSTGYAQFTHEELIDMGFKTVLMKPYTVSDFKKALNIVGVGTKA